MDKLEILRQEHKNDRIYDYDLYSEEDLSISLNFNDYDNDDELQYTIDDDALELLNNYKIIILDFFSNSKNAFDMYDKYTFVEVPQEHASEVIQVMKSAKIKGKSINIEPANKK